MTKFSALRINKEQSPLLCSYDFVYGPIYEPSYNFSFIFYDEEEFEEEEGFCSKDDILFHDLH